MNLSEIVKTLKKYCDLMELMPPANMIDVVSYERKHNSKLPESYTKLLQQFNGGEIFIPGTTIYGIRPSDGYYAIENVNSDELRNSMSIPEDFLVIGKLNFGDYICISLNGSEKVIQWDHENGEEFYSWDSIEAWLTETIEDYMKYDGEVE